MVGRFRCCIVVAVIVFAALALSSPALAGSGGLANATTFDFSAGPGESNNVTVAATGVDVELTDTSAVPTLTSAAALLGCSVAANTILCPEAGVTTVTIEVGDGNDRVTIDPSLGTTSAVSSVMVEGGSGDDVITNSSTVATTADYAAAAASVSVDLGAGVASQDGDGGQDTLTGIENVIGSGSGDLLVGDANDNLLQGGGGSDTLAGRGGNDTLDGGTGTDTADYAAAAASVSVDLGAGVASQDGDGGQDTLTGIENVIGSGSGDLLVGDANDNLLQGGGGSDTLAGRGGNDTLDGGTGTDTADYAAAAASVSVDLGAGVASQDGDGGQDTLTGIENVIGSGSGDLLVGDANDNLLQGGGGSDTLAGRGGNDTLDGGTGTDTADYAAAAASVSVDLGAGVASQDGDGGQDTLTGIENVIGSGSGDLLVGDANDNLLQGGGGSDTLAGRGGNDTLDGGTGTDTADYAAAAASVSVDLGAGVASQDGDGGQDTLTGIENVIGSASDDTILARDGRAEGITCGSGTDSVMADLADVVSLDCEHVSLPVPPTITPTIAGTLGQAGWYTSNVTVSWTVSAPGSTISSTSGCGTVTVSADTTAAGVTLTCTATSDGGTTTSSVTIKRDATAPTVLYIGNLGAYSILQTVAIGCSATDPSPGSDLATSSCATIQGPAYTFGAGAHTFHATATDTAGNSGQATTSFTVTPTPTDLCNLTKQFAETSSKYLALSPKQRAVVDATVTSACNLVGQIAKNLNAKQKGVLVSAYKATVSALTQAGWLTTAQAATLGQLANAL